MKYNQKLPAEVEAQLDAYIERIKAIKWFQPSADLKKEEINKQVTVASEAFRVEAFGVEASIEYRKLETTEDWDAARDVALGAAWNAARGTAWNAARGAAWDAARDAAWDAAWNAAWNTAWDAAWDAARDVAWDAAWDAAWGACDLLALNLETYKNKYPTGNFIHLISIWEAGLYPCGVIDGKFIIYVPKTGFTNDLI
jgi:hypothetical protein